MKPNIPLPDRIKNMRLPDKALLWIIVFAAFALLCLILLLTVPSLILKLLFLLLGIGAAGYCWIMVESRRITPKPGQAASPSADSAPAPAAPAAQKEDEAPELIRPEAPLSPDPQPGGQDEGLVFVSEKGDKYHRDRLCVGLRFADTVQTMTLENAVSLKRKPCSKCLPKTDKA